MVGPVLVKFPNHQTCEEAESNDALIASLVVATVFGSILSLTFAIALLEVGWLTAVVVYVLGGVAGALLVLVAKLNKGFAAVSCAGDREIEQTSEEVSQILD